MNSMKIVVEFEFEVLKEYEEDIIVGYMTNRQTVINEAEKLIREKVAGNSAKVIKLVVVN
jgi:hypothetical protein